MKDLFRQYPESECVFDGYPWAWGHKSRDPDTLELIEPIKDIVREQADYRCVRCGHPYPPGIANEHPRGEWTPCDGECTHNGPVREFNGSQAQWRILTVHHLDGDKGNCRWWNLAALCQKDHLYMQGAVVMGRPWPLEHSEWFKPYAAGFYASKYLGEDLTRTEVEERLEELLAFEYQGTQDQLEGCGP